MVAHPKIDSTTPDHIAALRGEQTQLTKAVGQGQPALRDPSGNILVLNPASPTPLLAAQGHDVALNLSSTAGVGRGTLYVTSEDGTQARDIIAGRYYGDVGDPIAGNTGPLGPQNVYSDTHGKHFGDIGTVDAGNPGGNVYSDTYGKHFGDIGTPGAGNPGGNVYSDTHGKHFGDLNGNSFGTHYGEVGTPNQLYTSWGDCNGTHWGDVGSSNGGNPNHNVWSDTHGTHFGAVVAPSERSLKVGVTDLVSPGSVVDAIPVYRWRWGAEAPIGSDDNEHAGVMVDDLDTHAPWLVRQPKISLVGPRGYNDRDLVGVLWGALRESRQHITDLQSRVTALETAARNETSHAG